MPCEIYEKQCIENYLKPILNRIHPELSLDSNAKGDLNILLHTFMQRILTVAQALMRKSKKCTIMVNDISSACKVVIPGELAKHALEAGNKAVETFDKSEPDNDEKKSRATHAGLILSVSRMEHVICFFCPEARISKLSPVFLAAVIEYLVAEILDLAGNACKDNKKHFITMRHVVLAIRNDEELNKLCAKISFDGGVLPNIHAVLLPKKTRTKASRQTA